MLISELKVNHFYRTHGHVRTHPGEITYIYGSKEDMKRYDSDPRARPFGFGPLRPGAMFLFLGHTLVGRTSHEFYMLGFGKIRLNGNDVRYLKEV